MKKNEFIEDYELDSLQQKCASSTLILEALAKQSPLTNKQLAKEVGVSLQNLSNMLYSIEPFGVFISSKRGNTVMYYLSPTGGQFLLAQKKRKSVPSKDMA